MGIEQRLDLLSPLQGLMRQIGESLKEALPSDAKVKIELEATPLQEVEASIARTKENAPESASSKLSEADPFAKATNAQEELDKAMGRIEAIAGRIGYLLQKIEGGKDATGNAAQEVERLRDSLEKVASKGREAAKSLGDEGLAAKINEAEKAAAGGHGGRGEGGSDLTPGNITGMLRNPEGAMRQGMEMAVQRLLGGGFLQTAAGAMLGMGAAVAGGIYGGWKVNDKLTAEATSDAHKAVADATLAYTTGKTFDFRGELFDKNRFGPIHQTRDLQDVSNPEVRSALRGMGIGLDNWQVWGGGTRGQSVVETAMLQANYAYGMGVSTDQIAGMVGAGVRSGAVGAGELQIRQYLGQIAGATEEAAKQGIATNEKLGVIASLNQRTVSETGMLSPLASKLNLQASAALEATGDRTLSGQSGANTLGIMAGSGSDESRAREIGEMMGPDGNLRPEYQKMLEQDPNAMSIFRATGSASLAAAALLDNPQLRAAVNQRMVRNIASGSGSPLLAARLAGVSGNLSQTGQAIRGFLDGNDILSQTINPQFRPFNKDTAQGKELSDALGAMWSGQQRSEVRQTGYEFEAAKNLNDAAAKLNAAADNLGKWLSDGTFANMLGASPMSGFGMLNRALH